MTTGTSKKIFQVLFFSIFSMLVSFAPLPVLGQTVNETMSSDLKLRPIDARLYLFGFVYSQGNKYLVEDRQFEELVYPLRDFEATGLLRSYESSKNKSEIFHLIGLAGLLTGLVGLLETSGDQQTPFWVTAIGGAVSYQLGGFFKLDAQAAQFNCVQRYNRFARGEEQILPQGPSDEKSLLNFDNGSVKPTATPGAQN